MDNGVTISVGSLVIAFITAMSVPSALTGFCFWLLERKIASRDKKKEQAEAEAREKAKKEADERERTREEYEMNLVKGTWAAIALGEATAKAVQRIPDAHCNGDMHKALAYAMEVKHDQKDFLTKQGIQALWD